MKTIALGKRPKQRIILLIHGQNETNGRPQWASLKCIYLFSSAKKVLFLEIRKHFIKQKKAAQSTQSIYVTGENYCNPSSQPIASSTGMQMLSMKGWEQEIHMNIFELLSRRTVFKLKLSAFWLRAKRHHCSG